METTGAAGAATGLARLGLSGGAEALPRLEAYLSGIPRGLDGFPDFQQKAAIYREFLAALSDPSVLVRLPQPLAALALEPLLPASWVSEVRFTALVLAVADLLGWSDARFVEHWHTVNQRVLSGRIYRVMFALASPGMALMGAETRWAQIHRGIKVQVDRSTRPMTLEMTYPMSLVPRLMAEGYTTAFRTVIDLSGGRDTDVRMLAHEPSRALFSLAWR